MVIIAFMENFHILILTFFVFLSFTLSIVTYRYVLEIRSLKNELKGFREYSEEELINRGKFSELGLVSAGITHEISNPLSIILGRVTQLLRINHKQDKNNELEIGLQQIKKNAERIASTIQSVREYIYQNDEKAEEFISIKDLINNALVFFRQRFKNHGIELRLKNVDKIYVSGNKGQFEQALLNLISNSFDAVDKEKEKWIEISALKTSDKIQIYVKDSGHGIPADVRSKMLRPFFTTKTGKGSGLGLSLARGIAQKHGGDLKYIEDSHTTFMLELPKATSIHYHH